MKMNLKNENILIILFEHVTGLALVSIEFVDFFLNFSRIVFCYQLGLRYPQ